MAMISSMILGLNWFKDTITCVIPGTAGIDKGYVHQACWIQTFYIYKQLAQVNGDLRYYDLPNALAENGVKPDGSLCDADKDENYTAMEKLSICNISGFPFTWLL